MKKTRLHPFNIDKKNSIIKSLCLPNRQFVIYTQLDSGFSLVELIAVVMMVGILAAIALPSWSAFVNRQRINKVNDAVLALIQQAQQQAKRQKISYSVSFKVDNQIPKAVIHPDSETPASHRWQPLGKDIDINPSQITLLTNLTAKNTAGASVNSSPTYLNTPQTITFDYMGTLDSTQTAGFKVVVSSNNLKRCVIVKTLLGAISTDKDNECS